MRTFWLVTLCAACGCGDNSRGTSAGVPLDNTALDAAFVPNDAPADSAVDATIYPPCDYVEQADLTNDYKQTPGAEEDTPLATGPYVGSHFTICGNINAGHYDAAHGSIDIDRFTFGVQETATVTLNFSGRAIYITKLNSGQVGVFVYDHATGATLYEGGDFIEDDAEFSATLPTGNYDVSIEAYDTQQDVFLSLPYSLEVIGS